MLSNNETSRHCKVIRITEEQMYTSYYAPRVHIMKLKVLSSITFYDKKDLQSLRISIIYAEGVKESSEHNPEFWRCRLFEKIYSFC